MEYAVRASTVEDEPIVWEILRYASREPSLKAVAAALSHLPVRLLSLLGRVKQSQMACGTGMGWQSQKSDRELLKLRMSF